VRADSTGEDGVTDSRAGRGAVAEWRRQASVGYQVAFVVSVALLAVCFGAGFLESSRHFGLPPIEGDATILGRALLARGDTLSALDEFRLAGLLDPENYDQEPALALERPPGVEALVRRGRARVSRSPGDANAHYALGRALLLDGDAVASVESLEQARRLEPGLRGLEGTLARAHLQTGALPAAEAAYRDAVAREPSNPDWHEGLGLTLYRLDARDEAARHFERARALRQGERDGAGGGTP